MSRLARLLICGLALCAVHPAAARAQTLEGFATLPYLAETDPDAALDRISAVLDAMERGQAPDPRVIFDLYRMAADLLTEGGQVDQAAQVRANLAGFAVQYRDFLGRDPLPIFAGAVALLRDTGQSAAARDTLLAMYDEQRASGAAPGALAETGRQIAQLSQALGEEASNLPGPLDPGNVQTITVYYATSRGESGDPGAARFFGGGRGDLAFGAATVSRPPQPRAADYSKLQELRPLAAEAWSGRLRSGPSRGIVVYAHGAATGFEQAARRAARLTEALGGVDLPLLYSWPASDSSLDYMADSAAAEAGARDLADVLEVLTQPGHPPLHLLARGMGARVLADALELVAARSGAGGAPRFGQLIFAAPDMDADRLRQLLPVLRPMVRRITLYASDRDWEMGIPRRLYGPALRAGWGGEATLTDPAADSVDLSALSVDMLDDPGVLADLSMLIWKNAAPARRCGLRPGPGVTGDVPIWRYGGGACSDPALVRLLADLRRDGVETRAAALETLESTVADPALRGQLRSVLSRLIGG